MAGRKRHAPVTSSPRFDVFVRDTWTPLVFEQWKVGTQATSRSALNKRLLPTFGRFPLHTITHAAVQQWFDAASQQTKGAANRNLEVLQSVFKLAVMQGHCTINPAMGIKPNKRRVLNRFLSVPEIHRLSAVLDKEGARSDVAFQCCDILRLLMLTGCRVSEITHLKGSYIHGNEIHLPDSKTGARVVHIGQAAVDVLARHVRSQDGEVFPMKKGASVRAVSNLWVKLRVKADIADVRIHDLRHTFASYAVMDGHTLPMVAKLLGHKRLSMTLRYTHVSDKAVEQAAEQVGNTFRRIVASNKPATPSNMLPTQQGTTTKRLTITLTDEELRTLWQGAESDNQPLEEWALAVLRDGARHDRKLDSFTRHQQLSEKHRQYHQGKRHASLIMSLPKAEYGYYHSLAKDAQLGVMAWSRIKLLDKGVGHE
jgi:integrase